MATIDYAALFAEESERVTQESIKPERKPRESKEDSRVINLSAQKGETKYIKGYFVTDASGKYMYYPRKLNSVTMIGLDSKEFDTYGFRAMDPKDYAVASDGNPGLTPEQINKIRTFRSNYFTIRDTGKLLSVVNDKSVKGNKNYLMNTSYYIFYMYVTEASGIADFKPGIYLIKTKAVKFNEMKTDFIKTTQKNYARFSPTAVQQFMENLVNNDSEKSEIITIEYTQNAGYTFKFSSDMTDTPFKIPEAEIAEHVKDLDTQYISKYEIDEENLDKTLAAMKIITDRIDELNSKTRVAAAADPMVD